MNQHWYWYVVALLTLLIVACADQDRARSGVPIAGQNPTMLTQHGHTRVDPYYWMRTDPALTQDYIRAEKQYLEKTMAETAELQSLLMAEMNSRLVAAHRSVPIRIGDYYYFREFRQGGQYPVYLRAGAAGGDGAEVILDVNELAGNNGYYELGGFSISPDQTMIAYTEDTDGDQLYELNLKRLDSSKSVNVDPDVSASVAWSADGQYLYYVMTDDASLKPRRLVRQSLANAVTELVYLETDPGFHVELFESSRDRQAYVLIQNGDSNEYRLIDKSGDLQTVVPRMPGHRYSVRFHNDDLYLLTNLDSPGFRLVRTNLAEAADPNSWQDLVAHQPGIVIDDFDVLGRYIVVKETNLLTQAIRIIDLETAQHQ
ncbi:MAG: hypothetical protein MI865_13930, partial [Proteobacteria bacterium]|nr:hypothetical protein [Pseudomonadota bacterium]